VEYLTCLDNPVFLRIPNVKKINLIVDGFQSPQLVYYQPLEWEKMVQKPLFYYCNSQKGWKNFTKIYWNNVKELDFLIHDLQKKNLKKLTNAQLAFELSRLSNTLSKHFAIGIWGVFILEPLFTSPSFLKQKFPNLNQAEIISILTPPKLAAHFQEELLLQKLNFDDEKSVKNHLKKFQWIPCVDLLDKPWTMNDLVKRQKALLKRQPVINLKERKKLLERYKKVLKKLSPSQRKLGELIHQLVYLKDHRDDVRFKVTFYIKNLYQEIAKRLKITLKELTFLTNGEIEKFLKEKIELKVIKNKIQSRFQGYVIKKDHHEITILTGIAAKRLLKTIISRKAKGKRITQIKGIVAMSGKAKGKVIIVKTDSDLKKVKEKSIMVAPFTRPHYLMAMRKSAAIITDEGGLTSHAAIVSRELKIPCIVGTKIATRVLKDGDLVEVDANKGVIRILER
jgi:phosphohistidine swiveling domain-containing protein